jgi:hypothetical protein
MASVVAFPRLSAVVDYYLCKACGFIWAVHKEDPTVIDDLRPCRNGWNKRARINSLDVCF